MNSRAKGAAGEREWAAWMREKWGLASVRGQQRSGLEEQDVINHIGETHCEVKRCEKVRLDAWMEQAVRDAKGKIPWLAHRRNRQSWMVTVRAEDLERFALLLLMTLDTVTRGSVSTSADESL